MEKQQNGRFEFTAPSREELDRMMRQAGRARSQALAAFFKRRLQGLRSSQRSERAAGTASLR
jgi:hypothetical protein